MDLANIFVCQIWLLCDILLSIFSSIKIAKQNPLLTVWFHFKNVVRRACLHSGFTEGTVWAMFNMLNRDNSERVAFPFSYYSQPVSTCKFFCENLRMTEQDVELLKFRRLLERMQMIILKCLLTFSLAGPAASLKKNCVISITLW